MRWYWLGSLLLTGCFSGGGTLSSAALPQVPVTFVSSVPPIMPPIVPPNSYVIPVGLMTRYPTPSSAVLSNPYHGFARTAGDVPVRSVLPQTLAYNNLTWAVLEPLKGAFDWAAFEAGWAQETALGRRIGFRLNMTFPSGVPHHDVPTWLITAGVPMQPYTAGGTFGSVPDWNNPTLLAEHDRVIAALGARYNRDPRIAWVDVGSYGLWGEWHLFGTTQALTPVTNANKKRILDAYLRAFPNKRLVIPFDDAFATAYLTQQGQGVRNDCLGPQAENQYYYDSTNLVLTAASGVLYQRAPVTGEFCNGVAGVVNSMTGGLTRTLTFVRNTHWSWIGPMVGELLNPRTVPLASAQALHNTLGYRFRVASVTHPNHITRTVAATFTLQLQNDGIAPFYYPWPVELSLLDATGVVVWRNPIPAWDVRTWLPGVNNLSTMLTLPINVPSGNYTLAIAILDPDPIPPRSANLPAIELAQTGKRADGRYPLSTLVVQ